ncbi:MAG: hypothetical protein JW934_12395 [Anaerolineae bacterium]|nr:hypothetical protein [Anaerolineae bacterium]
MSIRKEYRYFDVYPRIVRAGQTTQITVKPLFDHARFQDGQTYTVAVQPVEGSVGQTTWAVPSALPFDLDNGALTFSYVFEREQEYVLLISVDDKGRQKLLWEFHLYALDQDLFARHPFKGDVHMHSAYSDGRESPAYVAGACRRTGLDFIAVTDHRRYAPSLEAIRAFEGVDIDLRIYPGEEVHPPDNPVHIINFGSSFSVNDLFAADAYRAGVRQIENALTDLPPGLDPYPYASCVWCFDQIRAGGGLAVFCHPYWVSRYRNDVPIDLIDLIFERQPYDALELIGGYWLHEVESNTVQAARYHEERAKGKQIPVVGVSDAHGCERDGLLGWYYTVVFSPTDDLPDLISNIKSLYSVAVEVLPGDPPRAFGPFRLVRYAQFLLREVFPQHDELCVEEGRLMLAHAAGSPHAAPMLHLLRGRIGMLYDHLWDMQ